MNYFYIRVSCDTLSMNNQKVAIARFIKRNNVVDYELIEDISSGFNNKKGNKLFDLISKMNIDDTLYAYDISRISRSMDKLILFNQYILDKNIKFICINPSIDEKFVTSSESTLNIILSNITELESEYVSIIAKNALNKLKQNGVKLGAPQKYDENMILKVKELRKQGMSCQAIATMLGMSKATASRLARYEDAEKENIYIEVPINIKLELWADMKIGKSKKELSEKYNLDFATIENIISSLKGGGHW